MHELTYTHLKAEAAEKAAGLASGTSAQKVNALYTVNAVLANRSTHQGPCTSQEVMVQSSGATDLCVGPAANPYGPEAVVCVGGDTTRR